MDDCFLGSSELSKLLKRGQMSLHKWCPIDQTSEPQEFSLDRNSDEIT